MTWNITTTEKTPEDLIDGDFTLYNDYDGSFKGPPVQLEILEFLRVVFVLGLRIGYILIQLGSIPVENAYVIIYHNVIEIAVAVISFGSIGMFFSYGFVTEKFFSYWKTWDVFIASRIAIGSSATLTGTAQMSTYLVGRIHPGGAILLTILYCAFYQPLLMFLVWTKSSLLSNLNIEMRNPGFTLVAYIPSTVVGLVGSMYLGRRLIRIKDIDEFSIGNDHVTASIAGYLLIIMGYAMMGVPANNDGMDFDASVTVLTERVVISYLLALCIGILVSNALYYVAFKELHHYWMVLRIIQGGIAGMMTVSAATDFTGLWSVLVMAALGALLNFMMTLTLHNTALEDWCNMTSTHLVCAFLGAVIWPLFEGLFNIKILWQILYSFVIIVVTGIFALLVFTLLNALGILRNKYETVNHKRATNVLSNLPNKHYLERLYLISETQTPHILPGSSRRKYIPDDEGINIRDGPKPLVLPKDSSTGTEVPRDNERQTELMQDVLFLKEEKKLPFPALSTPPIRPWLSAGSGDYYGSII